MTWNPGICGVLLAHIIISEIYNNIAYNIFTAGNRATGFQSPSSRPLRTGLSLTYMSSRYYVESTQQLGLLLYPPVFRVTYHLDRKTLGQKNTRSESS